jgi:hypothetical protein
MRSIPATLAVALTLACTSEITDVPLVVQQANMSAAKYSDWSTPVSLGPVVNSTFTEQNAQLTKDGLAIYFSSDRPGGLGGLDIWVTRRASLDSPWEPPVNLGAPVNSSAADFGPNVSIDGHLLFYASARAGGFGGPDLYVARRSDTNDDFTWGAPTNLGPEVNTADFEQAPNYHQNAEEGAANLYFNRGSQTLNQADIYYVAVSRNGVALSPPVYVPELSFPGVNDIAASLRHDAKEVFFSSPRPGGEGSSDIYVSTRQNANDTWSVPVSVASLSTPSSDVTPNLSFDGLTILLGSNRPGGLGFNDLYIATRTRQ